MERSFVRLLNKVQSYGLKIEKCYGDGAYSWHSIFNRLSKDKIIPRIPLPKNAVIEGENSNKPIKITTPRDKALLEQYYAGGVETWKKNTDYHQRSLIENLFSRMKTIFGERLRHKSSEIRKLRIYTRLQILNKFSQLGLPKYSN